MASAQRRGTTLAGDEAVILQHHTHCVKGQARALPSSPDSALMGTQEWAAMPLPLPLSLRPCPPFLSFVTRAQPQKDPFSKLKSRSSGLFSNALRPALTDLALRSSISDYNSSPLEQLGAQGRKVPCTHLPTHTHRTGVWTQDRGLEGKMAILS